MCDYNLGRFQWHRKSGKIRVQIFGMYFPISKLTFSNHMGVVTVNKLCGLLG